MYKKFYVLITSILLPFFIEPITVFAQETNFWPTDGHDSGRSRYISSGPTLPLNQKWVNTEFENAFNVDGHEPIVYGDFIFVLLEARDLTGHMIVVYNRYSGEKKWIYKAKDDGCSVTSQGTVADNVLLVYINYCSDGKEYHRALKSDTGEPLWKKEFISYQMDAFKIESSPTSANNKFYVTSRSGIIQIDPQTGLESEPYPINSYSNPPIVDESNIYGLDNNQGIYQGPLLVEQEGLHSIKSTATDKAGNEQL